ncbi:MAG: VCBS repeat-containing protein [Planctomycetota bacterium]
MAPSPPFVDVTDQAGVRHRHHKPVLDRKLDGIMPWMASVGAAAAAADYDNDGDIDLYVTNSDVGQPNRLFRNNGDMTFVEVGREAGVADANAAHGASMDAVWGDYNNDGWLDLYVVTWGWNVLYRANGDGTFTDVTIQAGVGEKGNGNAAVWFDYNDDSYLDLYVGNYFRNVDLWNLEDSRQMHEDFETARDGGANVLYRNNGDGTFTEVGKELGVDDTGWALDVGVGDYDNDGDMDLACANDFGQDRIFRLNADATFTNVTDTAIGWDTHKGMNVEFGDYNNDGWLDLYVTNIWTKEYVKEGNQLYRNMGDGTFTDVSFEANVYDGGWCWAGRFWDYDNDGDLDIMVANGYIAGNRAHEYFTDLARAVTGPGFDPVEARNWPVMGDATFAAYEASRVWRNDGNEMFSEVAAELGLADTRDGRGLALADFDNDGDLDVYISNHGQDGVLYRNDLGNRNHWLQIVSNPGRGFDSSLWRGGGLRLAGFPSYSAPISNGGSASLPARRRFQSSCNAAMGDGAALGTGRCSMPLESAFRFAGGRMASPRLRMAARSRMLTRTTSRSRSQALRHSVVMWRRWCLAPRSNGVTCSARTGWRLPMSSRGRRRRTGRRLQRESGPRASA